MHSKIVPAELLPLMAKYTLPFNQSAKITLQLTCLMWLE